LTILHAIILGAVQGLTEFIPVSSTGHLVIAHQLMGMQQSKSFDAALHLGTLLALVIFFWRDWVGILSSFVAHISKRRPYDKDADAGASGRLFVPIVVGCIPAAIVGAKWGDAIDKSFSTWCVVAAALVVFGLVMLLGERMGKKQRDIGCMTYADYLSIGIAQVLAVVFPGASRSGVTIAAGLFRGLTREAAARFSFLLSMPVVLGAGVFEAGHIDFKVMGLAPFVCGVLSAAVLGYASIGFLLKFLRTRPVTVFVLYRICLAAVLVAVFMYR